MNWREGSIIVFVVVLFMLCFGTVSAETLREAVEHAIKTNPDIQTVKYKHLAREQEVRQARSGYFPKFDVNAGIGVVDYSEPSDDELDPRELTLSLRQNVFAGLSTMNEIDRQKARVRSTAFLLRDKTEEIALRVSKAYLETLRKKELESLANENVIIHGRISDQINLRGESGVSRKADMDQVKGRLALAKSSFIATQINVVDAYSNYQAVVGRLPLELSEPESVTNLMPASMDDAVQQAVQSHPALKSAKADLEARMYQKKVARSPFMPILDIEIDKYWGEDVDGVVGKQEYLATWLRLRFNLFQGWKDKARKVETEHLITEAQGIKMNAELQAVEAVRLSWMAYQAMLDRVKLLEEHVEATSATSESYGKQFNIGQRTLLDVLDTSAEVINAKKDLLDARYDGLIAQYRILNDIGQLVPALGLEWPEESNIDDE